MTVTRATPLRERKLRRALLVFGLSGLLIPGCTGGVVAGTARVGTPAADLKVVAGTPESWPMSGWQSAPPDSQGVDPGGLADVERKVAAGHPQVRSILVVRHGYLVYERYWHGLDASSGHDIGSATATVISVLVGIAVAEGFLGLDQTVGELLARHLPKHRDPRMADVTVRHLLSMTAGLPGDKLVDGDPHLNSSLLDSRYWIRHILGQPLQSDPGRRFAYSSAGAHLLSAILTDASGESALNFARTRLFGPLGIDTEDAVEPVLGASSPWTSDHDRQAQVAWPVDPQGYQYGASLLQLPSRDLAKVGLLYLSGGRWGDAQLVPAEHVRSSTAATGSSPNAFMNHGWLWWVDVESGRRSFRAQGSGGQYIHVVPDLDLVTVITSDADRSGVDPRVVLLPTIVRSATA